MRIRYLNISLLLILFSFGLNAQTWQSNIVYIGNDGKLVYVSDSEGNRIPDFSGAGFKGGGIEIPFIPVVKTIEAIQGDNTAHIQNAINEVAALPVGQDGFRGALLLKAGSYQVNGTIRINQSGIILRGEGDGDDPSKHTIIFGKGNIPHQRTILIAGGGSLTRWSEQVSGSKTNITTQTVFVGSKSFSVESTSPYNVGDNIIIYHPITEEWINAVGGGGTATDPSWTVQDAINIIYNRYITGISGNEITVDVPLFYTLDRSLSQSYIYKYSRSGLKTNIGIEDLRIEIEAAGTPQNSNGDENHAWHAIELKQIEDAWVKNCTMLHFGQSGIMTSTASRITIDNCKAIDPISIITGERRYNFNMYHASQQILVQNSYTRYGRHDFVSNGTSTVSGIIFYNNVSDYTYSSSEGHRWWSQGILFDNITFNNPNTSIVLALYNRGDNGTSHGWASVNSVAWNCKVGGNKSVIIQKPPTAQNYSVGNFAGKVTGLKSQGAPYDQPQGFIEGTNLSGINPPSLYKAQLDERLITSLKENSRGLIDDEFILYDNFPNPFNPSTNISFKIPVSGHVSLKIYDLLGKEIATLIDEFKEVGSYHEQFSISGLNVSSGIYFYSLRCGNFHTVKKMVILK
ncbi:MAG TPA: T9SS type A sorting domain-containing protein [Melioribacteraceae bacterium]|nr:T9SS type A sorting domain-containing protein [Melioribacteraceae bacterium]